MKTELARSKPVTESQDPASFGMTAIHETAADCDPLQSFSDWIDDQLIELELRFHQFQTSQSVKQSIGR